MTNEKQSEGSPAQSGSEHAKHQDKGTMGNKPPQHPDQSKVGQDTDNDGRVVKPGHKPGDVDGDKQHPKK